LWLHKEVGGKPKNRQSSLHCHLLIILALFLALTDAARGQLSTDDHLADLGFWPTQGHATRDGFVGADVCAQCHASMVASQKTTPMAQAAMPSSLSAILHSRLDMTFTTNGYKYRIQTSASQSKYSIEKGSQSESFPLSWAFGTGRVGQSYLFKKADGGFYEARVTYFESLGTLGVTPFRALPSPSGMDEAMYRPVPQSEVVRCFSCHATAANIGGRFDEEHLFPGVACEACHGPGANHVKEMSALLKGAPTSGKSEIFNSLHLSPTEQVEFCGACHSTWWDVKLSGATGVSTTRSAPYRLVTSKCWGTGDERLTCTKCHDPHEQLETNSAAYDKTCLQCHTLSSDAKPAVARSPGTSCPVAVKNCTSCHMRKVLVPEMNDKFTDHRIRIPRAGEAFPE
jgi:hypothetical protein